MHCKALVVAAFVSAVRGQSLISAVGGLPALSNLTTYLQLFPDITDSISGLSNITLLAPSNAAFTAAIGSAAGSAIATNSTDLVTALLQYHILQGVFPQFSNVTGFLPSELMPGAYANVTGGQVVEAVTTGRTNSSAGKTSFTSGLQATTNKVGTTTTNFTGGVIHIVDTFLTLPPNISSAISALDLGSAAGVLGADSTLVKSIDLMKDVTAFIPNDAAFQAVSATLATSSPADIARILEYHVVNGTVGYSSSLKNGTDLVTMNGVAVTITVRNGTIYVNSAKVVTPNVLVANGVIHVIDNVLNPGNATAAVNPTATKQPPAFTSGPTSLSSAVSSGASAASSSKGAAAMQTGAVGAAALFGGAAALLNM